MDAAITRRKYWKRLGMIRRQISEILLHPSSVIMEQVPLCPGMKCRSICIWKAYCRKTAVWEHLRSGKIRWKIWTSRRRDGGRQCLWEAWRTKKNCRLLCSGLLGKKSSAVITIILLPELMERKSRRKQNSTNQKRNCRNIFWWMVIMSSLPGKN